MKIQNILRCLTVVTLTAMLCVTADVMAKPKEKKEKITDPRLLTIMKMSKTTKETQFIAKGTSLKTGQRAVQGFDVSSDEGTLWFSQPGIFGKSQPGLTKLHENYIIRVKNGKRELMTVNYFGNANNVAIESTPEGDYVWLGSCGTKWKGAYSRTRAVSRFLFEPGTTVTAGHAGETYYMGGERYVWAAVDAENDLLGVTVQKAGVVSIFIYSLSEARSLPDTDIKIKTEWKGENIGEEQETVVLTIKGKDLTTLEPLSSFVVPYDVCTNKLPDKSQFTAPCSHQLRRGVTLCARSKSKPIFINRCENLLKAEPSLAREGGCEQRAQNS